MKLSTMKNVNVFELVCFSSPVLQTAAADVALVLLLLQRLDLSISE